MVLISFSLWMWSIRLKTSILVEVILHKTESVSSVVMFKRKEYLWALLWNDSE